MHVVCLLSGGTAASLALATALSAQQPTPRPAPNPEPDPVVVAAATAAAEAGGTGPYKATMVADPSLPTHTIYRPRDLAPFATSRLPVIVWGNGACANVGNRFRYFLTEIASHGYFAIAIGPIGPAYLEGQASLLPPGTPPPTTPPATPSGEQPSKASQLIDAMNWATAQNADKASPYYGKLDVGKIAVMGQSCGGLQAILASADPRTTTSVIWNSGTFPEGRPVLIGADATKASLSRFHAPVAYISGDESDIAFANSEDDFARITQVPAFRAYAKGVGHTGTYRTPNGGMFSTVAVAWLDWQLKGDAKGAAWFKGSTCKLCLDSQWVVKKKGID